MKTFQEWAEEHTELFEMAKAMAWESDPSEEECYATIRGYKVVHPSFLHVIQTRNREEDPEGLTAREIARRVLFGSRLVDEDGKPIPGEAGTAHISKIWEDTAERNKWTRDVRAQLKQTSNRGRWSNLLHFEVVPGTKPEKFRLTKETEERGGGLRRTKTTRSDVGEKVFGKPSEMEPEMEPDDMDEPEEDPEVDLDAELKKLGF